MNHTLLLRQSGIGFPLTALWLMLCTSCNAIKYTCLTAAAISMSKVCRPPMLVYRLLNVCRLVGVLLARRL